MAQTSIARCMNRFKTMSRVVSVSIRFLLVTMALAILALSGTVFADTLVGKVIGVSDGDTIDVLDKSKTTHRIRLSGIDAPEKAQPFGQRSKEHLSDSVFGKQVEVVGNKIDKYGRTVGKIMVNGVDANLEQVRSGFAWHYKEYAREQSAEDRTTYAAAEVDARAKRIGLWHDPLPTPPWEWRHGNKAGDNQKIATQQSVECPCSGELLCTGSKGGHFCIKPNGKKQY